MTVPGPLLGSVSIALSYGSISLSSLNTIALINASTEMGSISIGNVRSPQVVLWTSHGDVSSSALVTDSSGLLLGGAEGLPTPTACSLLVTTKIGVIDMDSVSVANALGSVCELTLQSSMGDVSLGVYEGHQVAACYLLGQFSELAPNGHCSVSCEPETVCYINGGGALSTASASGGSGYVGEAGSSIFLLAQDGNTNLNVYASCPLYSSDLHEYPSYPEGDGKKGGLTFSSFR